MSIYIYTIESKAHISLLAKRAYKLFFSYPYTCLHTYIYPYIESKAHSSLLTKRCLWALFSYLYTYISIDEYICTSKTKLIVLCWRKETCELFFSYLSIYMSPYARQSKIWSIHRKQKLVILFWRKETCELCFHIHIVYMSLYTCLSIHLSIYRKQSP